MIYIGSMEVAEGINWFTHGDETQRGDNPLREQLRFTAKELGIQESWGERLYYAMALGVNLGSMPLKVSTTISTSVGQVTVREARWDTLSNIQRAAATGDAISNAKSIVHPNP